MEAPSLEQLVGWGLASVRTVVLFHAAPLFGHAALPRRVRAALALWMTFALAPAVPESVLAGPGLLGLGGAVLLEALIGLTLGFAMRLVFAAFDLLGEFVAVQGGLGAATVIDPSSGASSMALASTFQTFALMVFLALDGHHDALRALAVSYQQLPVGAPGLEAGAMLAVVRLGASIFEVAVRMAAPITVAMMIANVAVGILGRVIPQLNLMMLQLPAHVAVTLALLLLGARSLLEAAGAQLEPSAWRALEALLGDA